MANTTRVRAIMGELNRAAEEYVEARGHFEAIRVQFAAAKEKFAGIRKLAAEMLPGTEWHQWQEDHRDLALCGLGIGDAILNVLSQKAYNAAFDNITSKGKTKYAPMMFLEEIVEEVENGGFEFDTATPRKEVSAALINLKGVAKLANGRYQSADHAEILQNMKNALGPAIVEAQEEEEQMARQEQEEEVPF